MKDKGFNPVLYTQEETQYITNGTQRSPRGQLCANCRWFQATPDAGTGVTLCRIVESYPEPILNTGWCKEWEATPSLEPEPLEVVIVEPDSEPFPIAERSIGEIFNTAKEAVYNLLGRGRGSEDFIKYGGFKAIGNSLWFAAFTNNFEDREKEILSESAHDKFITRTRMGLVDMPELWFHHIPGTRHGKAKFIGRAGHMVYAVGTYDDTDLGRAIEQIDRKAKPGEWGLSHGFLYPKWAKKGRVYTDYNTFEITKLRPEYSANVFTPFIGFSSDEEFKAMPISEKEQALIRESFPGKVGDMIIEQANQLEKGGERVKSLLGTAYKDFVDATDGASAGAKSTGGADSAAGVLLPQLVESQGDIIALVTGMEKKFSGVFEQMNKTIADQTAEINRLKTALGEKPESASASPQTVVNKEGDEAKKAAAVVGDKKSNGTNPYADVLPGLFG